MGRNKRDKAAMADASDAALIASSEADAASFGVVFDRHVDQIYAYIVRRVGRTLAEELTAETFARAFEQRGRFVAAHESAGPWLYGIATNVVHNAWRAERRQLAAYRKTAAIVAIGSDDFGQVDERVDAERAVAEGMVRASECQWVQQWLSATAASKDGDVAQALRILPGIIEWLHAAGSSVNGYIDDPLLGQMRRGDVAQVQSFSNGQCAFTGSWGATASAQDAKAAADLMPAIQVVRSWLDDGGDPTDFGWREGDDATPLIVWTDVVVQPAPLFPGSIYIAPTTEDGVMLVSTSESGSRYCAVIGDAGVERGIVDPQRYPPDPTSINTPWDKYPGPVGCSPGEWPAGLGRSAAS